MAVTERTRHELHEGLVELMGPERAATMMESLPPVGWGDIVTKDYLDLRLDSLENRINSNFDAKLRQTILTMVGMMTTQTAVLVALVLALR